MRHAFAPILAAFLFASLVACASTADDDDTVRRSVDTGVGVDVRDEEAGAGPLDSGELIDAGVGADAGGEDARVGDAAVAFPDQDDDGIPDVEDPSPTRANPSLLVERFGEGSNGWLLSSVSMSIDPATGVLRTNVLEPYVREGWIGPRPQWTDYYVRSSIRVNDVGMSMDRTSGRAGIIARVNQVSPDRYLFCALDLKEDLVVLTEHDGGGPEGTELARAPAQAGLDEWVNFAMLMRGTSITCRVGDVSINAASSKLTYGAIGFRSFDATFEADFIEAYDL